jgi:hypothetical protein
MFKLDEIKYLVDKRQSERQDKLQSLLTQNDVAAIASSDVRETFYHHFIKKRIENSFDFS